MTAHSHSHGHVYGHTHAVADSQHDGRLVMAIVINGLLTLVQVWLGGWCRVACRSWLTRFTT